MQCLTSSASSWTRPPAPLSFLPYLASFQPTPAHPRATKQSASLSELHALDYTPKKPPNPFNLPNHTLPDLLILSLILTRHPSVDANQSSCTTHHSCRTHSVAVAAHSTSLGARCQQQTSAHGLNAELIQSRLETTRPLAPQHLLLDSRSGYGRIFSSHTRIVEQAPTKAYRLSTQQTRRA